MSRRHAATGLGLALALAVASAPAAAEDNGGLIDPWACSSPFGGTSGEGTVITVPGGTPMPTGTPPPPPSSIPGAPYPPPTTTYVCVDGGWVPISSALEVGLVVAPAEPALTVDEGSPATMTGTYTYAGEEPVTMQATVGTANALGDGTWTWSTTPDDGPAGPTSVTVTGTAGTLTATATFDLTVDNVAPTVTGLVPEVPVAVAGDPVSFAGTATDPSSADTTAGFGWGLDPDPAVFSTCGSHTVSATATDKDGGVSQPATSDPVEVVEAAFGSPVAAGNHNLVRAGQVVPVKVTFGCGGIPTGGLAPTIRLVTGDVDPDTSSNDPDVVVPATDAKGETSGLMREVGGAYLYNLRVPTAAAGSLFTVQVRPVVGAGPAYAVLEVR